MPLDAFVLSGKEIERLRLESMGFVFQSSILLEDFSAEENAAMPLLIHRTIWDDFFCGSFTSTGLYTVCPTS